MGGQQAEKGRHPVRRNSCTVSAGVLVVPREVGGERACLCTWGAGMTRSSTLSIVLKKWVYLVESGLPSGF